MNEDEVLQKQQAKTVYLNQAQTPMMAGSNVGEYRPSPLDDAEKRMERAYREADLAQQTASFLRQHPEFGEFIQLIRKGAISI